MTCGNGAAVGADSADDGGFHRHKTRHSAFSFVVFTIAIYAYIDLMRRSPLATPALALVNMFVVYSLFDNMIATTSIFMQLVWPWLLGWIFVRFRSQSSFDHVAGAERIT